MYDKLKENMTSKNTWIRGFYMLLFALIYGVAKILVAAVAVFQFFSTLFTGKTNENILTFGQSLGTFIYQIIQFFTFNSEEKPYPFSPWPQELPEIKKKTAKNKAKTGKEKSKKKVLTIF